MPKVSLVMPRNRPWRVRLSRTLRAIWHDSWALWREFRVPFVVFILSLVVGGWAYGELLVQAGYDYYPFIDRPFMMLELMVLESPPPGYPPPEPYLIVFWYAMPFIAIYVLGRGAVDFIRLFFNRSERHDAWELAVASTYRNHVILVGIGHVGLRVLRELAAMSFDVVGVDLKVSPEIDDECSRLGVPLVFGDARDSSILTAAGLPYARALIICTSDDYMNLQLTMHARELNPDVRIVVRAWDSTLARQMRQFFNVEAVLSASDLVAPAFAGAALGIDIAQTLHIDDQEYSMIQLIVQPGSFMDGAKIGELEHDEDIDIMLHQHDEEPPIVHPPSDITVQAGDTLVMFAKHAKITEIVERNYTKKGR